MAVLTAVAGLAAPSVRLTLAGSWEVTLPQPRQILCSSPVPSPCGVWAPEGKASFVGALVLLRQPALISGRGRLRDWSSSSQVGQDRARCSSRPFKGIMAQNAVLFFPNSYSKFTNWIQRTRTGETDNVPRPSVGTDRAMCWARGEGCDKEARLPSLKVVAKQNFVLLVRFNLDEGSLKKKKKCMQTAVIGTVAVLVPHLFSLCAAWFVFLPSSGEGG